MRDDGLTRTQQIEEDGKGKDGAIDEESWIYGAYSSCISIHFMQTRQN